MFMTRLFTLTYFMVISYCNALAWIRGAAPWRNNTVVYSIDNNFRPEDINLINEAFIEYNEVTCIRFRQRTHESTYVWYEAGFGCCQADPGFSSSRNRVCLGWDCRRKRAILHETTHVLGFGHEHQRVDRGIYLKNTTGAGISEVAISTIDYDLCTPYDYMSVTHYCMSYWKNMETVDPTYQTLTYLVSKNLSFYDLLGLNQVYKCDASCRSPDPCRINSFRGKDCKCHCDRFAKKLADPTYRPHDTMMKRVKSLVTSNRRREFVCSTSAKKFRNSECGTGWIRYDDTCYKYSHIRLPWPDAVIECQSVRANILTPRSQGVILFITKAMTSTNVWINAKYDTNQLTWKWQDTSVAFRWQDINFNCINKDPVCSTMTIRNCAVQWQWVVECPYRCDPDNCLPPQSPGSNSCPVLRDKRWREEHCGSLNVGLICQKPYGCPGGWTRLKDNCYKLNNRTLTFREAERECQNANAQLTTSMSKVENTFLTTLLPITGVFAWLYAVEYTNGWYWRDTYEHITSWTWTPYWRKQWPDSGGRCLLLHRDGYWASSSCYRGKISTICRKPYNPPEIAPDNHRPQHFEIGCHETWHLIRCDRDAVIKIRSAIYGRSNNGCTNKCGGMNIVDCRGVSVINNVAEKCDGRWYCYVRVGKDYLLTIGQQEPCPGVCKYLEVGFDCEVHGTQAADASNVVTSIVCLCLVQCVVLLL